MEIEKENLSKRIPTRDYSSLTWYLGSRPANQLYQIGWSRLPACAPQAWGKPPSQQSASNKPTPRSHLAGSNGLCPCDRLLREIYVGWFSLVLSRLPQSALNLWGWTDHVTRKHLQALNRDPIQNQFLVLSPLVISLLTALPHFQSINPRRTFGPYKLSGAYVPA